MRLRAPRGAGTIPGRIKTSRLMRGQDFLPIRHPDLRAAPDRLRVVRTNFRAMRRRDFPCHPGNSRARGLIPVRVACQVNSRHPAGQCRARRQDFPTISFRMAGAGIGLASSNQAAQDLISRRQADQCRRHPAAGHLLLHPAVSNRPADRLVSLLPEVRFLLRAARRHHPAAGVQCRLRPHPVSPRSRISLAQS